MRHPYLGGNEMNKPQFSLAITAAFLLLVLGSQQLEARPVIQTQKSSSIQSYSGKPLRINRQVSTQLPSNPKSAQAWQEFESRHTSGQWQVLWDQDTAVPLRIYGSGLSAPDVIDSASMAASHAQQQLIQNMALLAPGSQPENFKLVSNTVHNGVRAVGFQQLAKGLQVQGGQVSFRYKNDRLIVMASEAWPDVVVNLQSQVLPAAVVSSALNWMHADVDATARLLSVAAEEVVLPLIGAGSMEFVVVRRVQIATDQPVGRWDVYVNASTGEPVARHQRLMFSGADAQYNTPDRWPGGTRSNYPAAYANLTVGGQVQTTNILGEFTWSGPSASVDTAVNGPLVAVNNEAGANATINVQVENGATLLWSEPSDELLDAQLTAFIHANYIKEYVLPWNPTLAWLDQTLPVAVNINDSCNAYSDGNSINFFREGNNCSNTGRLVDVIYHEFGHSLHSQSIIPGVGQFDSAMSEGVGDFLSATAVNDASMAPGFFLDGSTLRELDPIGSEAIYPDDLGSDPHISGLIYGGAFWDLRKALILSLGETAGVAKTEQLFYATLQRAVDMPTSYIEVLLEDDDDGDLNNGTPNYCDINQVFSIHGLTGLLNNPLFGDPEIDGLDVSVPSTSAISCNNALVGMTLEWQNRNNSAENGQVSMTYDGSHYRASIPFESPGEVVQYKVVAQFTDDSTMVKPRNQAAPWYEQFIGLSQVISCTDFETNPFDNGWTHELTAGTIQEGADDWQWNVTMGNFTNKDATTAYSGSYVIGNDLGEQGYNGLYQSNITNQASSPVIATNGYEFVRLQYRRWLNVEDGLYDQATIYANDTPLWSNFASDPGSNEPVNHHDKEWRFHDVDLSNEVVNDAVQLTFEIASDGGSEFGGWTIDDVCVVGYNGTPMLDLIFRSGFE